MKPTDINTIKWFGATLPHQIPNHECRWAIRLSPRGDSIFLNYSVYPTGEPISSRKVTIDVLWEWVRIYFQ